MGNGTEREELKEDIEKLIDNINKMNDDQFVWFIAQALPVIFCKEVQSSRPEETILNQSFSF